MKQSWMEVLLDNWLGAFIVAIALGVVITAIAEGVQTATSTDARGEFMSACVAKNAPDACAKAWESSR